MEGSLAGSSPPEGDMSVVGEELCLFDDGPLLPALSAVTEALLALPGVDLTFRQVLPSHSFSLWDSSLASL